MAERVKELIEKLIEGSQNAVFSRIVILASFIVIVARDIAMIVLNSINSDDNQLSYYYYIFFLTFQILWSYSSWIMLLLFFYPDSDDLPEAFDTLQTREKYPMEIFQEILEKLCLLDVMYWWKDEMDSFDSGKLCAFLFLFILIFFYQITLGLPAICCCIIILLIPFLMLQAIKIAILGKDFDRDDYDISNGTMLCECLLILWCFINFVIINAFYLHLSAGVIIMELVYALITLWFFAIIPLKTIGWSNYTIVSNPLVLIIGFVTPIFLLLIVPMVLIFIGIKHCLLKCINYKKEARETRELERTEQEIRVRERTYGDIVRPLQRQLAQEQQKRQKRQLQQQIRRETHKRQDLEAKILKERQDREKQDRERQQIDRQRQEVYREDANQPNCGICQENVFQNQGEVAALPCGNMFHENCIRQWFANNRKTCPYCKTRVQSNDIIQVRY